MLNISFFRESPGYCGPAALKLVLRYFGIDKTEAELAVDCKWTEEFGTTSEKIVAAAHGYGLEATMKDYATLIDLRQYVLEKKIPVIVNWFSEDYGHYSVVVDITDTQITLQDPQLDENIRTFDLETFQQIWFDYLGRYPEKPSDFVIRRMIVIFPKR